MPTHAELLKQVKITVTGSAKRVIEQADDWRNNANGFRCTLRYQGRRYSFDFWQGVAHKGNPTVEGTLECLISDALAGAQSFEDYCETFGYDTDSRKAEEMWKACKTVAENMRRLLGKDFDAFAYPDQD